MNRSNRLVESRDTFALVVASRAQRIGQVTACSYGIGLALILGLAAFVSGCAGLRPEAFVPFSTHLEATGEPGRCAHFFNDLDGAVHRAEVSDAGAARIPGFPYLRVDRFLASGVEVDIRTDTFGAWVDRLQKLDRDARATELANLSGDARSRLATALLPGERLLDAIDRCGELLRVRDLRTEEDRRHLLAIAKVPDSYSTSRRIAGLYPLTSLIFLRGVYGLHADLVRDFAKPIEHIEIQGKLVRFAAKRTEPRLTTMEVATLLRRSSQNPLGIPEPTGHDRERLFATFAPTWELDVSGDYDLIGTPIWTEVPVPNVDVTRPAVYRRLSHVRFFGEVLLQLNYVVWFPARPTNGVLDLLGGHMDGLIWRVTLGADGRPLVYDTIHNCGCYHLFFPTERLRMTRDATGYEEPVLAAQRLSADAGPLRIRVASGTHFIQRVYAAHAKAADRDFRWADYQELCSLPRPPNGRRSLFRADGIVPGTERRERWLFWPMGIIDPGAMRQWGTHAIAFVGRRHFDDPDLLSRYFEPVNAKAR